MQPRDQEAALWFAPIIVSRSSGPLRSAGIHHTVIVPVRQERNVSLAPSRVHNGQCAVPVARYNHGMNSSCGPPGPSSSNYDVTPDGRRFLMIREAELHK
jgi:hypothetical protein